MKRRRSHRKHRNRKPNRDLNHAWSGDIAKLFRKLNKQLNDAGIEFSAADWLREEEEDEEENQDAL